MGNDDPGLSVFLFLPHIFLASIFLILLIVSFLHYHIKRKKKARQTRVLGDTQRGGNTMRARSIKSTNKNSTITIYNTVHYHGPDFGHQNGKVKGYHSSDNRRREDIAVEMHETSMSSIRSGLSGDEIMHL